LACRVAPLLGRAQAILAELWRTRQLGCRLLFHVNGKRLGELKSEWRRACAAAGLVAGRKAGGVVVYAKTSSLMVNTSRAARAVAHAAGERTPLRPPPASTRVHESVASGGLPWPTRHAQAPAMAASRW